MANQQHLDVLKQGVEVWNEWMKRHLLIKVDLSGANLRNARLWDVNIEHANLSGINLSKARLGGANLQFTDLNGADLHEANLIGANLHGADLRGVSLRQANLRGADLGLAKLNKADLGGAHLFEANLTGANLSEAKLSLANLSHAKLKLTNLNNAVLIKAKLEETDLQFADLNGADLHEAILSGANLHGANLSRSALYRANLSGATLNEANLEGANLREAILIKTNMENAILNNCFIYGISAWDVRLEGAKQSNLVITYSDQPAITVDNLKVAQFIYLLLNNAEIREVIDTIAKKAVLILGRFTPERKAVLDAIRDELRKQNYTPVLFDFEKPASRDFTETVRTLAHLSRFIIAELTDPSSIPQELQAIVPDLEAPVQPLLLEAKREYSMFVDFRKYHWVLPVYIYKDRESLISSLQDKIIEPAEKKARELALEKAKRLERP